MKSLEKKRCLKIDIDRVNGNKQHDDPEQGVPGNWINCLLFGFKREVANEDG